MIKQIISGWWHYLFYADANTKKIAKERLTICMQCPLYKRGICKECGCYMRAKVMCLFCKCPKDKWSAIISEEDILNGSSNTIK